VAVFVDGCFWHGCQLHGEIPVSNREFWETKITTNRERDRRQTLALEEAGWRVVRVWEHEPVFRAADEIEAEVRQRRSATPG
jgi:DNA mismatch endonuclease (patch repair protein)